MRDSYGAEDHAEILRLILKCLPAFVIACDTDLRFTLIRGSALQQVGVDDNASDSLLGSRVEDFFRGPEGERILQSARAALAGASESFEIGWRGRWYNAHVAPLRDEAGAVHGVVAVGMDITPRHQLEEQVHRERQLLEDAQMLAEVGSWSLDVETGQLQISTQLARLLGIPVRTQPFHWSELASAFSPHEAQLIASEQARAAETCGTYDFDHDIVRPDGTVRRVRSRGHVDCNEQGKPLRCVGTMLDITERVEAQRAAELLAYHDALTGLPNRWLLQDRLQTALASAERQKENVFVAFIDLDDFKRINDSLGHALGDVLLAEVGHRLFTAARSSDTVARMGGDEFVVVLTHMESEEHLDAAIRKLRTAFVSPFRLAGTDYAITASIGVAGFPDDARTESELLRFADAAMYDAKQHGRNAVRRYSGASVASSVQRVQLENDLRRAVREREFEVYYQPIVNATSLRTVAVEALLRWRHPTRGLLLPTSFLHAIEYSDDINTIGEWVLRQACTQVAGWRAQTHVALRLSVNVSAKQLQRNRFAAVLARTLRESGLSAQAVDIELTENTVVHDLESAAGVLGRVREIGVGVSIDDFGTGYNSLSYLKHFPITGLKIDRTFVSEMGVDTFDEAISSAVIALGKALGIRVVAEGVEQRAQFASLVALGCDEIQGFYFAPPMQAHELALRLAAEAAAG
ncbi:MAG TPA: EAL domain-containing protein [Candidatus Baltobacteraceae bacterium]|nr:EAL domain-containing protein [Candidatus Baltobacteraceae bacterium]